MSNKNPKETGDRATAETKRPRGRLPPGGTLMAIFQRHEATRTSTEVPAATFMKSAIPPQ